MKQIPSLMFMTQFPHCILIRPRISRSTLALSCGLPKRYSTICISTRWQLILTTKYDIDRES